jgi:RimJ/RimL family protein N-acetyltransferase
MVDVGWTLSKIMEQPEIKPLIEQYRQEMIDNGWPTGWKNSDHFYVMAIWNGSEPVSFICHAPLEKQQHIHITGAWTRPEYRGRGIYTKLFGLFIKHYASTGEFHTIWSGYNKDNKISAHIQKQRGAEINEVRDNSIRTRYLLPSNMEPICSEDLAGFVDLIDPPAPIKPKVSFKEILVNIFKKRVLQ